MSHWRGLIGRLEQTLGDLESVSARVQRQLAMARQTSDDAYVDAVALNLQSFYTGAEQALEAIAIEMDGGLPQGANWHRELLRQLSAPLVGLRPPVLQSDTKLLLDELRRFRHVVRNVYAHVLDPSRIAELGEALPSGISSLRRDLQAFMKLLEQLDREA